MACLNLEAIINYANISPHSRNLVEAERLLKAEMVITFGTTKVTEHGIDIFALCLQTSAMKESPHTIKGTLLIKKDGCEIGLFACSCKAGAGVCKHKTAVLLLCYRTGLNEIPQLSSTDVKCIWACQKPKINEMFMPVPVSEFCCVKYDESDVGNVDTTNTLAKLLRACPDSELALCLERGKRQENIRSSAISPNSVSDKNLESLESVQIGVTQQTSQRRELLKRIFQADMQYIQSDPEMPLNQQIFYQENVCLNVEKALYISEVGQNTDIWKEERKVRITASNCYELYTYTKNKSPNWEKKIRQYHTNSFEGNAATNYGLTMEVQAFHVLKQKLNILKTGLLVHPRAPWLGYSPDGLILINQKLKTLEIKCPIQGAVTTATELVKMMGYVYVHKNGMYALKEKHKYYGQVQCGMHIANVEQCYFVIFASYDNSYVLIHVNRDSGFIKKQYAALYNVYFNYMLPYLCVS